MSTTAPLFISRLILSVLLLSSCISSGTNYSGRKQGEQHTPIDFDLDKIKERGYLVAIMENSSTGLFLYKGKTMGFDYELLKAFTDSLGIGLRIVIANSIEESFDKLNEGEGDIIAYNLSITAERKQSVSFSVPLTQERQVLVQRKPENWQNLKAHEIEAALIKNTVELNGKSIWVRSQSVFAQRLSNLAAETGIDIQIIEDFPEISVEQLIEKVANGDIDYTVADEHIALVNATYFTNTDVSLPISFPQQIGWAVRKNADELLNELNNWLIRMQKYNAYYAIYERYYKNPRNSILIKESSYSSLGGGKISPYDDLLKKYAAELDWDWRLLAAIAFKESKFNPDAESWAGAVGLFQVLPSTAQQHGFINLYHPETNIKAATRQLIWLERIWKEIIPDKNERIKFILASYNVGQGHVFDARKLALKYNENPDEWEVVAKYLIKKMEPKYYRDPDIQFGYCRGHEPVNYVLNVLQFYHNYLQIYPITLQELVL